MPFLAIRDVQLYYETYGQGAPILFIHGLGSSTRDWEYQIDFFSQDHQVIVVDVRGHGKSDRPPGPYSIPLFASDLVALLQTLDLVPVHVVGISMGGMIGLQLAVDAPDLVRSLVATNCSSDMIVTTWKQRWQVVQRFLIIHVLGMKKMGQVLGPRLFPKEEQAEVLRTFVERWAENARRAYWQATKGLLGWSVTERLSEISCPVLVIAADGDYTPVELKAAYTGKIPQGRLQVIENSRHATPVDQPKAFNNAVWAFLQQQ
jgi:pimeloyl-ACP methyl ester carboxylesterase